MSFYSGLSSWPKLASPSAENLRNRVFTLLSRRTRVYLSRRLEDSRLPRADQRDSSSLKWFEGTFSGRNEEFSNNNNWLRVDRERGWKIIVARVLGRKNGASRGTRDCLTWERVVRPHCSAAITRDCRQSRRGHNKTCETEEPRGVVASRRHASPRPRATT